MAALDVWGLLVVGDGEVAVVLEEERGTFSERNAGGEGRERF